MRKWIGLLAVLMGVAMAMPNVAQAAHGGALKTATTQPTHGKHHKHKHLKKKAAKKHHHKSGKKGLKTKAGKSKQA